MDEAIREIALAASFTTLTSMKQQLLQRFSGIPKLLARMQTFLSNATIQQQLNGDNMVSSRKMGILGQVALNDPAQNPHLGNALNDPSSEQLKEISQVALIDPTPRNSLKQSLIPSSLKEMKTSLKKSNPNKKSNV